MIDFQILVDTWEGQGDLDEKVLRAGGVTGIISRLNSMSGGHHKDDYFDIQWEQSKGFIRWPYFVYNPWVTGVQNYNWLMDNLPNDATTVSVDIEVRKTDYPKTTYAEEVAKFVALLKPKIKFNIYTGGWFLSYLEYWSKDADYWWAQYPYSFWYEGQTTTWERVRQKAGELRWPPANATSCPGTVMLWQCSGDKLVLPGTNGRPADINVFNGTLSDLAEWSGQLPPVVTPSVEDRLARVEKYLDWAKAKAQESGILVPDW